MSSDYQLFSQHMSFLQNGTQTFQIFNFTNQQTSPKKGRLIIFIPSFPLFFCIYFSIFFTIWDHPWVVFVRVTYRTTTLSAQTEPDGARVFLKSHLIYCTFFFLHHILAAPAANDKEFVVLQPNRNYGWFW